MYDSFNIAMSFEKVFDPVSLFKIYFFKKRKPTRYSCDAIQYFFGGIRTIIDYNDFKTFFLQFDDRVGSDEPEASCNQYLHVRCLAFIVWC